MLKEKLKNQIENKIEINMKFRFNVDDAKEAFNSLPEFCMTAFEDAEDPEAAGGYYREFFSYNSPRNEDYLIMGDCEINTYRYNLLEQGAEEEDIEVVVNKVVENIKNGVYECPSLIEPTVAMEEFDAEIQNLIDVRREDIRIKNNKSKYGGLFMMDCSFPMVVNGIFIKSFEHLFYSCRFPNLQKEIIEEPSPLGVERITKPHTTEGRSDWSQIRIGIVRWCLRVQLACNYDSFGLLLDSTGNAFIVNASMDVDLGDATSQVKEAKIGLLLGGNILGELLMELREEYRTKPKSEMLVVQPLQIPDFILFGNPIEVVDCR